MNNRGYHTLGKTGGRSLLSPQHFKALEEESFNYQAPKECLHDLKFQQQLPDGAYPSCDTSMSSLGLQSCAPDPIPSNPFSNFRHNSISHALAKRHSASPPGVYPQTGLYVANPNRYDTASHHSVSPAFSKDPSHFIPVQNMKDSENSVSVHPMSSLQTIYPNRNIYCVSPANSTSESHPKFLLSQHDQVC